MPRRDQECPIDRKIGQRVRAQRIAKGMSRAKLGNHVGVKSQQILKYETGTNQIGAGRLQRIAEALGVPVSLFFDTGGSPSDVPSPVDDLRVEGAERLLRAYSQIARHMRRVLIQIAEHLAGEIVAESLRCSHG